MEQSTTPYPAIATATRHAIDEPPKTNVVGLFREINAILGTHPHITQQAVSLYLFGQRRMDYWLAMFLYTSPDSTTRVKRLALACLQNHAPDVWEGVTA